MDEHVFKIIESDELNESFRISVEFQEQSFNLTILQKLKAWMATVDQRKICMQAKQLELDSDEYYKRIREYIIKAPKNVEFKLVNNEFFINCSLENNMRVKYFTCKMKEVDYSKCMENLVEKQYTDKINALRKLKTAEEERCLYEKEKNSLKTKLNEFIARKKTDDQELYDNFITVLNEKKKRIQHLSELLEAFKRGRPTVIPPVEVKKKVKKSEAKQQPKTEVKKEISDSESEDSYNTDEEKQKKDNYSLDKNVNDNTNRSKSTVEPMPSTSKCDDYNLFGDESPPRHLLPKRVKTESSVDVNNIGKHSATAQGSENGNRDDDDTAHKASDNSPNVNFSTQDLLDNM